MTSDTTPDDDIVEPPNSTVDDWHGQQVARQEELADRAMEEAGGDEAAAERIFKAEGGEEPEQLD
jgi:hypothetical protein